MNTRLAAIVGIGLVPWSLVVAGSELTLVFAWGFSRRLGTLAVPVGTAICWAVVWWFDWDAVRRAVG